MKMLGLYGFKDWKHWLRSDFYLLSKSYRSTTGIEHAGGIAEYHNLEVETCIGRDAWKVRKTLGILWVCITLGRWESNNLRLSWIFMPYVYTCPSKCSLVWDFKLVKRVCDINTTCLIHCFSYLQKLVRCDPVPIKSAFSDGILAIFPSCSSLFIECCVL